jgi:ABC-type multidrug transport system fused ATPase/permease subunit
VEINQNNQPKKQDNTTAILALVFSFIFAPAGLILGIIALKKNQSKGMAITSIVYSGIVSFGLFIMFLAAIFSTSSTQTNTANTNTTITKPTQSELDSKAAEEAKKQAERDAEIKRIADQKAAQINQDIQLKEKYSGFTDFENLNVKYNYENEKFSYWFRVNCDQLFKDKLTYKITLINAAGKDYGPGEFSSTCDNELYDTNSVSLSQSNDTNIGGEDAIRSFRFEILNGAEAIFTGTKPIQEGVRN